MPSLVHSSPFIIRPPDDFVTNNLDLKNMSRRLANKYADGQVVTNDDLQIMGRMLWSALDIQSDFDAVLNQVDGAILPIIVQSDAADVQALPWETFFHPTHGFIGKNIAFSLTRQPSVGYESSRPLDKGPLRVLLFTSLPDDVNPETGRLNVEEEQAQVQEVLLPWISKGLVQLELPDDGRFSTLKDLLQSFQPHILFLSGHGRFHHMPHADEAYGEFLFESETGESEAVKEDEIANALTGVSVQAVILSACESGKVASDALSNGLIHKISAQGIPHVIGIRESISDMAGIEFAYNLCNALANQEYIDIALQRARKNISEKDESGQWCLPMLISSDPHTPLIDWKFQPKEIDGVRRFKSTLGNINLPMRFVGRRTEMRKYKNGLSKGEFHKLLITGSGGQGKTALAGKLALDMQQRGWQVFSWSAKVGKPWRDFELEMEQTLEKHRVDRYNHFLPHAKNELERVRLMLNLLMEQFNGRIIFFLDGLDSVQDPNTQELNSALIVTWMVVARETRDLILLATSRWQIPDWDSELLMLAHTSYGDFLQMAQRFHLPVSLLERREELHRVYDALGGNSRGLEFFAIAILNDKKRTFSDTLAHTKADLQEDMAIEEIFNSLPKGTQKLLMRFPTYHKPVPLEGLIKLGRDLPDPKALMERLLAVSLLETSYAQPGNIIQFQCNSLVMDWLGKKNLIDNDPVWLNVAADYNLYLFNHEQQTLSRAIAAHHALRRAERHFQADRLALDYIIGPLTMAGSYTTVLKEWLPPICNSEDLSTRGRALIHTGILLKNTGNYKDALSKLKQGLDIMKQTGNKQGQSVTLNNMAQIFHAQGDYDDAIFHLKQSLPVQQEFSDKLGESATLNTLAAIYQAQGNYNDALENLKEALTIQQEAKDMRGEGAILSNIAQIHHIQGDYETALVYLKQGLAIQQQIGDKAGEGTTLNNISQIYKARSDYETALMYLKQALTIHKQTGNTVGERLTLDNILEIYVRQGEYEEVLQQLKQELAFQQQIGDKAREGRILNNISGVYRRRGDYKATLDMLEQALTIQQQIGDRAGKGTTLNNIASVYQAQGDYEKAMSKYKQALKIRQNLGDKAGQSTTLNNIATVYQAQNNDDLALEYFKEALVACQQIGNKACESTMLNNIATIYQARGDYKTALEYFKKSLTETREIGDQIGEGTTLDNIGLVYQAQGDHGRALEYLNQGLVVRQQLGDKAGEGQSLNNLSQSYLSLGDNEKVLTHLQQALTIQQEINDKVGQCITFFNMGHFYLKNKKIQDAIRVWSNAYLIAKQKKLVHILQELANLAPTVGLPGGLDDWEMRAQKIEE